MARSQGSAAGLVMAMAIFAGPGKAAAPSLGVTYLCEGGAVLRVAYVNAEAGESFVVIDWGGRLVPLRQVPAASGARYGADDPESGLVWHSRGEDGMLAHRAPEDASESVLLSDCRRVD